MLHNGETLFQKKKKEELYKLPLTIELKAANM